jgi:hypothetical protein
MAGDNGGRLVALAAKRHLCTSSSRSTPSLHDYYPLALEDGGMLAAMAADLFYRLAVQMAVFPNMGAADSRSLRS